MRLALLLPLVSPWARAAARSIAAAGVEAHLISFDRPAEGGYHSASDPFHSAELQELSSCVCDVHLLSSAIPAPSRYFVAAAQLRALLRRIQPDVLLTFYAGGFATMAWLSGFRPYVVYTVGSDVLLSHGLRRRLTKRALATAALVISNGKYLARRTQDITPNRDIVPLYLGVNTDELTPGAAREEPTIICTRGFLPLYNNRYVISGLAQWATAAPSNLRVVFTSPGPELNEVSAYADRVLPEDLRRRVEFFGGITRGELIQELRRAIVYVSMSSSDGTSASLLEALACGLYPVLSDLPQNREWVSENEQNGILVPFDAPDMLASAFARAVRDEGVRDRARTYNRGKVVQRANAALTTARLVQALDAAVQGPAAVREYVEKLPDE